MKYGGHHIFIMVRLILIFGTQYPDGIKMYRLDFGQAESNITKIMPLFVKIGVVNKGACILETNLFRMLTLYMCILHEK